LLASTQEGQVVEVAMAGIDGMVGIPVALGMNTMPYRAIVQVEGTAFRLATSALREELDLGGPLRSHLLRYASGLLSEITQSAICNRFHSVKARLCRWLLVVRDRTGLERFSLTQEFLSQMLGSRRQGVNEAIDSLQEGGLIMYKRGSLSILSCDGIECAACECYSVAKGYRAFHAIGR
jgi:CRP-like cAMP-binding protein